MYMCVYIFIFLRKIQSTEHKAAVKSHLNPQNVLFHFLCAQKLSN